MGRSPSNLRLLLRYELPRRPLARSSVRRSLARNTSPAPTPDQLLRRSAEHGNLAQEVLHLRGYESWWPRTRIGKGVGSGAERSARSGHEGEPEPLHRECVCKDPGPARVANSVVLLLLGSKPELLQDAQIVVCFPLLDYLAVLKAVDGDAFELYLPLSGRAQVLRLSSVGAAYGVAAYRLITLG